MTSALLTGLSASLSVLWLAMVSASSLKLSPVSSITCLARGEGADGHIRPEQRALRQSWLHVVVLTAQLQLFCPTPSTPASAHLEVAVQKEGRILAERIVSVIGPAGGYGSKVCAAIGVAAVNIAIEPAC